MYFERIVAAPPEHAYYDIAHVRGKREENKENQNNPNYLK